MNIAHEHSKIIAVFSGNICNTEEADWRTFKAHNTVLHLKVVTQFVSPPCGAVLKSATQHKAVSSQDKVPTYWLQHGVCPYQVIVPVGDSGNVSARECLRCLLHRHGLVIMQS